MELHELGPSYRGTDPEGAARWLEIELGSSLYERLPTQPPREPNNYARLSTMPIPNLILSVNADLISSPALMRMQAAHIQTARLARLPNAGHWEHPPV